PTVLGGAKIHPKVSTHQLERTESTGIVLPVGEDRIRVGEVRVLSPHPKGPALAVDRLTHDGNLIRKHEGPALRRRCREGDCPLLLDKGSRQPSRGHDATRRANVKLPHVHQRVPLPPISVAYARDDRMGAALPGPGDAKGDRPFLSGTEHLRGRV